MWNIKQAGMPSSLGCSDMKKKWSCIKGRIYSNCLIYIVRSFQLQYKNYCTRFFYNDLYIFYNQTLFSGGSCPKNILLPFMLAPSDGHHIPKSSFLLGHFSRFYYSEIFSENRMLMHIIIQLSSSQLESLRIGRQKHYKYL